MATRAAHIAHGPVARRASWLWLWEFIRWEVAPYPGRVNMVIRITVTATLVMLIVFTFRIPNAFLAAYFSILLARENLAATQREGRVLVLGFIASTLYTLLGVMLFRGYPLTHFFWVVGSFYLVFFVMRTTSNYAAAIAFGVPIVIALPVWDRVLPSELQVEGTLWPVLIIAIGAGVTVGTEALYRIFDRSDPLIASVDALLVAVQQVAASIAVHRAPPKSMADRLFQYHVTGTGRLRMTLQRQGLDPPQRARYSALISLSGRLISLAADLVRTPLPLENDESIRLRALSERLGAIRTELRASGSISPSPPVIEGQPSFSFPVLLDMERTVALITEGFQRDEIAVVSQSAARRGWWRSLFLPDLFQNPDYRRFAFAGCLAASVCYFLYNALDWPGISTSVLTCVVTALSTIGNSLQKQIFRLAGFVVGGIVMGFSAQILILPGIDSIFGFALFFAAATAIAAWFATSSPRLSYFGLQIALAFYFVNLQDFHVETDLTIARDKVMGVLLGILAMGFIFDRFGAKSDAEQLQKLLVRNVQLLAQLAICPVTRREANAISEMRRLGSQINDNFTNLESQMDAARFEFEFRHRREEDVAECGRIQTVQPWLRSIYLLELSLLSRRGGREIDSGLSQQQNQALDHFLSEYSDKLMHTAAWIAREEGPPDPIGDEPIRKLQQTFENQASSTSRAIDDICRSLVSSFLMLRRGC
jgi:multidrug resistance protein MdtO